MMVRGRRYRRQQGAGRLDSHLDEIGTRRGRFSRRARLTAFTPPDLQRVLAGFDQHAVDAAVEQAFVWMASASSNV